MQEQPLFTLEQFKVATSCNQSNTEKFYPFVLAACALYAIDTNLRIAAFLSQIGHESASLTSLSENLNYSYQGLMKTWPKRFPTGAIAKPYHRNPEKIANKVYSNRMQNGDELSGDGWRYRGRGLKQLTGKYNYIQISNDLGIDFVANPDELLHPLWASVSAAWFWSKNNCNFFADKGDIIGLTKRINGGTLGIDDRLKRYKVALAILSQVS